MQQKFIGLFCLLIFIIYGKISIEHIDFIFCSKESNGMIVRTISGDSKSRLKIHFKTYDGLSYLDKEISIKNHYVDKLMLSENQNIEIMISRWFNQIYIKEANYPNFLILIFDSLVLFLFFSGIKLGIHSFKNKVT